MLIRKNKFVRKYWGKRTIISYWGLRRRLLMMKSKRLIGKSLWRFILIKISILARRMRLKSFRKLIRVWATIRHEKVMTCLGMRKILWMLNLKGARILFKIWTRMTFLGIYSSRWVAEVGCLQDLSIFSMVGVEGSEWVLVGRWEGFKLSIWVALEFVLIILEEMEILLTNNNKGVVDKNPCLNPLLFRK